MSDQVRVKEEGEEEGEEEWAWRSSKALRSSSFFSSMSVSPNAIVFSVAIKEQRNLGEKERRQKLQTVEKRRRIRQGKTMSFAENMQSAERSTVKNLYNCVHREVKDVITMSF